MLHSRLLSLRPSHLIFFSQSRKVISRKFPSKTSTMFATPNTPVRIRFFSTISDKQRISSLRNVGIFAHVDAGKTTLTENMLAYSNAIRSPGLVDQGSTVTDYMVQERERGITIQSACISFLWPPSPTPKGASKINLIDTPGHVDFSIEIARSVAVLDGAVLVVDGVEGVQAQTETVWSAMQRVGVAGNLLTTADAEDDKNGVTPQKPLPCFAAINKLDRVGADFYKAVATLNKKLTRQNPADPVNAFPIQLPLVLCDSANEVKPATIGVEGPFAGIIDLVSDPMRRVTWSSSSNNQTPDLHSELLTEGDAMYDAAVAARQVMIETLANVDENIEELYLMEETPSEDDIRRAIRTATISNKGMPVLACAALKRQGVEPIVDAVTHFLPSPLDCPPPSLILRDPTFVKKGKKREKKAASFFAKKQSEAPQAPLGAAENSSMIALCFKVVHVKGRGGGDGRIVFARVFSGALEAKKSVRCVNAKTINEGNSKVERPAALLELFGGRMDNLEGGVAKSGDVCAIVGLKDVGTGDTIVLSSDKLTADVCLAGVTAPRPVLTVRLDPQSTNDESKLEDALRILCIEDPSLISQTDDDDKNKSDGFGGGVGTLLSGLGELHIDISVDRLRREFGVDVKVGEVKVALKETLARDTKLETGGLINYEREIAGKRMQAAVELKIERIEGGGGAANGDGGDCVLRENVVVLGENSRRFLQIWDEDDEAAGEAADHHGDEKEDEDTSNKCVVALIEGVKGALSRGPVSGHPLTNVKVTIVDVSSDTGLAGMESNPGTLRAAASSAVRKTMSTNAGYCEVIEPVMKCEISVKGDSIGAVLSDFANRQGQVGGVNSVSDSQHTMMGTVPLRQILGYATTLRSLTGGSGVFATEYINHRAVLGQ